MSTHSELLKKYELGTMKEAPSYYEYLTKLREKYMEIVAGLLANVEVFTSGATRIKTEWIEDRAATESAALAVKEACRILVDAIDSNPRSSAAIYSLVQSELVVQVKNERDENVHIALSATRKFPVIPKADLDGLKEIIHSVYFFCDMQDVPLDAIPTKYSKTLDRDVPALPRPPMAREGKIRNKSIASDNSRVTVRKFQFTVDGKEIVGGSPLNVRKIVDVKSVGALNDALGISGRTNIDISKTYTATINGHTVSCVVVDVETIKPSIENILNGTAFLAAEDEQESLEDDIEYDDDDDDEDEMDDDYYDEEEELEYEDDDREEDPEIEFPKP